MKNMLMIGLAAMAMTACASKEKPVAVVTPEVAIPTKAQAVLKTVAGQKIKGMVHFTEADGKMTVETMVEGLKAGPHGFHIHETGDCSAPDFTSAGGHFNPHNHQHGAVGAGSHVGDLGNIIADKKMNAKSTVTVEGVTMKPGTMSIIGKAVVIHKDKDDLKSQPAGNAGPRIACGVIEALD